LRDNLSKNS